MKKQVFRAPIEIPLNYFKSRGKYSFNSSDGGRIRNTCIITMYAHNQPSTQKGTLRSVEVETHCVCMCFFFFVFIASAIYSITRRGVCMHRVPHFKMLTFIRIIIYLLVVVSGERRASIWAYM